MKKLAALLLLVLMMTTAALAEIEWPAFPTTGQAQLQTFVENANTALAAQNAGVIDIRYEMYSTFASLGMDGADMPEDPFADFTLPAEMYFTMNAQGLHTLQLRMPIGIQITLDEADQHVLQADAADLAHFAAVAAACLHASSPSAVSVEQALGITNAYAGSILASATTGFGEEVNDMQGNQPRAYFAYFPNQFHDNKNSWVQMTLIFPLPGSADAPIVVPISTPAPEQTEDEVWLSDDNYTHLELFASPTPEPDSAAME